MELPSLIIFIIILFYAFKNLRRAILVVAPISILFQPYFCIRYDSPAISLLFAVQMSIVGLYLIKKNIKSGWRNFPLKSAYIWILIVYLIGVIVSPLSLLSVLPMCISILLSYLFIVIYWAELKDINDVKISLRSFVVSILILSIYFLYEFITQSNIFVRSIWEVLPIEKEWIYYSEETRFIGRRCQSLMAICISWGALCCIAVWTLVYSRWNKHKSIAKQILIVFLIIGIISSGSRSAYVFAAILLLGWVISYKGKYKYVLRCLSLFIIILFAGIILNSINIIFDEDISGSNVSQRQLQFIAVFDILVNSPIWGYGIKGLEVVRNNLGAEVLGAESVWLQQLIQFGILGVIQQIILYLSCLKLVRKYSNIVFLLIGWIVFSTMSSSPGLHETYFLTILLLQYKYHSLVNNDIKQV